MHRETKLLNLIDTHCHLNDHSFSDTMPGVLARAQAVGVGACIVPAYDVASLERTAKLALGYPGAVFPAYGLHPWFIYESTDLSIIRSYIIRNDTVAVGEIGLDFSPPCLPADIQKQAFISQLEMAADLGLPVLIHCRKAYGELYEILHRYKGRIKGVLHSYSGGKDVAPRFADLDYYFSFSGSVTRKNAVKYHRTAEAVPLERMLLETDAPAIATESTAASGVEPCHILEIAQKLAEIRRLTLPQICRLSTENAQRLFPKIPCS